MSAWPTNTIEQIATSDDLHIYPYRADGITLGTPTWIWSVVVDGSLFVRAYNGTNGRWYKSAMSQAAGRIDAAGQTHDVVFAPADPELAERIDAAYEDKYTGSQYLSPMISDRAKDATVEIAPRY